jgi:hypothetical protein
MSKLTLDNLVGRGKQGKKNAVVEVRIVHESAGTLSVQVFGIDTRQKKNKKRLADLESVAEKSVLPALSFDERFWTADEWKEMLGLAPCGHWVDRILLFCRAQVKAKGERPKIIPYVLLPDSEVVSTWLFWPPVSKTTGGLPKNPLTRLPPTVVVCAVNEFQCMLADQDRSGADNQPVNRDFAARWLEKWLRDHKATTWWLSGLKPGDPKAEPETMSQRLVTTDNVRRIDEKLEEAGFGRFVPRKE